LSVLFMLSFFESFHPYPLIVFMDKKVPIK
jgi:hypothetical protein